MAVSCSATFRLCSFTPACIRTTTHLRIGPRRSTTAKWSASPVWCTRPVGTSRGSDSRPKIFGAAGHSGAKIRAIVTGTYYLQFHCSCNLDDVSTETSINDPRFAFLLPFAQDTAKRPNLRRPQTLDSELQLFILVSITSLCRCSHTSTREKTETCEAPRRKS